MIPLPNEEKIEELAKKYTLRQPEVGSLHKVRVVEDSGEHLVVKSFEKDKKSKIFIGVVPKCLSSGMYEGKDFLDAIVLENLNDLLPILSL